MATAENTTQENRKNLFNAFDMNCVAHQSPGLWTHPKDKARDYNTLDYWAHLAKTLEKGPFRRPFHRRCAWNLRCLWF